MPDVIHLISDLHLCQQQPQLLTHFKKYIEQISIDSQQLYVLGDLFEVWVGDDNIDNYSLQVIELFKHYSDNYGQLFFLHGNRDFLLGEKFAQQCGGQLIQEPFLLNWQNKKICLMHGDVLCSDDTSYQEFRKMVRSEAWQSEFLGQSINQRLAIANNIRQQSKHQQQQKDLQIMDVNSHSVVECFIQNQCDWLIHGHTHREGSHQIALNSAKPAQRIVLSDWGEKGHYLELINGKCASHFF